MKLTCAIVNDWRSVEVYHNPDTHTTWKRVKSRLRVHAEISPWSEWFEGPCWSQQLLIRRPEVLEKRRDEIITEIRARITRAERVNAIWAIMMAGQVIHDAANILPIINSYLLALYPAIIPESIATVESWMLPCGSFGDQKPQYDFSDVRCGKVIPSVDKVFHKFDLCRHVDCGFAVINGEKMPVEKCLLNHTSYIYALGLLGDNVLWCAHVSRLANR